MISKYRTGEFHSIPPLVVSPVNMLTMCHCWYESTILDDTLNQVLFVPFCMDSHISTNANANIRILLKGKMGEFWCSPIQPMPSYGMRLIDR